MLTPLSLLTTDFRYVAVNRAYCAVVGRSGWLAVSVGATENALMAAARIPGTTVIKASANINATFYDPLGRRYFLAFQVEF